MKKNTKPAQNKKPSSKKLSAEHESDNAGNHKRAHHRGSAEKNKDLKDTSSRATRQSEAYRSATTKK
jgi:hypothetical protein